MGIARAAALFALLAVASAAPAFKRACDKPDAPPAFEDKEYYADALSARDADELRASLAMLLSNNTLQHSYSCVWDMLEEADEDPNNSNNVILMYTGESWPKSYRDDGSSTTGWNREHSWPTSHGFSSSGDIPYTDAHHIRACEKRVNSIRSDKDYREGGEARCLLPYNNDVSDCEVIGYETTSTFEVPDAFKGQQARAIFYLEARYQGQDSDTPHLTIVEDETFRSGLPLFGWLCTLIEWHNRFPVTAEEILRNDVVYSWQYNRNPFVDHPEWVDTLWSC